MINQNINMATATGVKLAGLSGKKMKKCSKCKIEKPVSEFHKDKTKEDGVHCSCKKCKLEVSHQRTKRLVSENKCPGCGKINLSERYVCDICYEIARIAGLKYRQTEKGKAEHRRSAAKRRKSTQGKAWNKEYYGDKRKNDIHFRLACALRGRFKHALARNSKTGSGVRDLGCPILEFKKHIEDLWEPNMSWDNYGTGSDRWHLDHFLPISAVDLSDRKQFLAVANFKNIRPLWSTENIQRYHRERRLGTTPTLQSLNLAV